MWSSTTRSIAFASCLAACGAEPEAAPPCAPELFDSLGAPYPTIRERGSCFPSVGDDTPTGAGPDGTCGGEDDPSVVFAWGRFFEACPACGSGFISSACRPLVCTEDADCPLFENQGPSGPFTEEFECRNGLCQSSDLDAHPLDEVYPEEALLLCSAAYERDEDYDGPEPCPGIDPLSGDVCPLPLPAACLQP